MAEGFLVIVSSMSMVSFIASFANLSNNSRERNGRRRGKKGEKESSKFDSPSPLRKAKAFRIARPAVNKLENL